MAKTFIYRDITPDLENPLRPSHGAVRRVKRQYIYTYT